MRMSFGLSAAVAFILCSSVICASAVAQTSESGNTVTDSAVDSKWSFGMQAAPLIFGLSVRYHVTDLWQIQGMVQPAGEDLSVAARAIRTSTQKEFWRSYLFAGVAHADEGSWSSYEETAATVGLGVEWSWAAKNPSLPPLSWGLELGLGYSSEKLDFEFADDEESNRFFLALGASIHYHFE